jgi:hypothetical protein
MAALQPPRTQKADVRPIAFVLKDLTSAQQTTTMLTLAIRPEDMTRTDPSRSNVQQSLGGAWADVWGPGVATINISGHTGWRRTSGNQIVSGPPTIDGSPALGAQDDGEDRFRALRSLIFDQWHQKRADAVAAGKDPSGVQLIFVDGLDQFAVIVIPGSITLRRSRSRPLLCQYQIPMTVLGDLSSDYANLFDTSAAAPSADAKQSSGIDSLLASIDTITTAANGIHSYVDQTLAAPVRDFMNATATVYQHVNAAVTSVTGITGSLLNVAQLTSRAGANMARTIMTIYELPDVAKMQLMQVAAAYTNVFCLMNNAFGQQAFYADYTSLYGSANCSSTSGGRPMSPLADVNPFYVASPPAQTQDVVVSASGHVGLLTLASTDVVLAPLSPTSLLGAINSANAGTIVAAA